MRTRSAETVALMRERSFVSTAVPYRGRRRQPGTVVEVEPDLEGGSGGSATVVAATVRGLSEPYRGGAGRAGHEDLELAVALENGGKPGDQTGHVGAAS